MYTVEVKLKTGQNPTTFISAYYSPCANIQETLWDLQEIITSLRGESIIIGAMWRPYGAIEISTRLIKFTKWDVSEEPSLSDHKYINVKIESQIQNSTYNRFISLHGNHTKFLNKLKPSLNPLLEEIRNRQTEDDIKKTTIHFQIKFIDACKSTYKTKKQEVARPPSWYTSKLEIEGNGQKRTESRSR
ncbi:hypothetical protein AVEN_137324-1 [Araneus ventricosus]|uniref:Endonuclease/exonuclease/phosphatase domain-containing protein n=1 Tax=Araneus ventricosus TaxID=182803 RepID=A0A4Y2FGY4_ARAVE|nr:hypothetical protein AVEN_137324-1 [Araneus ventricosus]